MKRKRKKSKWKKIVLVLSLGLLCVGGVELMVCRVADPALYARVTAPARALWAEVSQTAGDLARQAGQTARDLAGKCASLLPFWGADEPEPEPPEDQAASEPPVYEPLELSDPAVTEMIVRDGQEILTGGSHEIVYFQQSGPKWADQPYGTDNIGKYGCGPTVMAMAVSSLTGRAVDPVELSYWAVENGHWASRSGSRHSIVEGAAQAYGLEAAALRKFEADALIKQLAAGKLVVALMTRGHFTSGGHFILLRGATLSGKILVADPNSPERSLVQWDPQVILDELSPSRDAGSPLWLLSLPDSG